MMTIVLVLAATRALAQEPTTSPQVLSTNRAVVLKVMHGTRSTVEQGKRSRSAHDVTTDALCRFVEIQNADGSWGPDGTQQLDTAFCLISFLRLGETRDSADFGNSMAKAQKWLLTSRPQTDSGRIATAIALSDWITVHYRWHGNPESDKRNEVPDIEIQKIRECLGGISPKCGEMWADLLSVSRFPKEIDRRRDVTELRAISAKYLDRAPPVAPSSTDDYLLLFLCARARFTHGGQKWSDWNRQFTPMMIQIQEADGLFPCKINTDRITATGMTVMSLTIYYIWAPRFFASATLNRSKGPHMGIDIRA